MPEGVARWTNCTPAFSKVRAFPWLPYSVILDLLPAELTLSRRSSRQTLEGTAMRRRVWLICTELPSA